MEIPKSLREKIPKYVLDVEDSQYFVFVEYIVKSKKGSSSTRFLYLCFCFYGSLYTIHRSFFSFLFSGPCSM